MILKDSDQYRRIDANFLSLRNGFSRLNFSFHTASLHTGRSEVGGRMSANIDAQMHLQKEVGALSSALRGIFVVANETAGAGFNSQLAGRDKNTALKRWMISTP